MLKSESLFRCVGVDVGFIFFFGHSNSNFRLIAGSDSYIYHLHDSKISKKKYGEYLNRSLFGL